jgi:hypothetical protein
LLGLRKAKRVTRVTDRAKRGFNGGHLFPRLEKAEALIADAVKKGAKVVLGGERAAR